MKKVKGLVFSMVAALIVLTLLAGCASNNNNNASNTPANNAPANNAPANTDDKVEKKDFVVGFSQGWSGITWTRMMREEVLAAAKEKGVNVTVSDGDNKAEKQLADIEDFITKKVDILLIHTYHAQAIAPGVQKALDQGIPVIVMASEIPGVKPTVFLSVDSLKTGRMAGEYIAEVLKGEGNIIHLTGLEGSTINKLRGEGFDEVLAKTPGLKRIAKEVASYERGKAVTVMENLLQVHKDVNAVYAHNDEMAMGAIQVLKQQGYKFYPQDPEGVVVVGVDALEQPVLKTIQAGELAASLRYVPMGEEAIQMAIDLMDGKSVEAVQVIDTPVVTQADVDQYITK